jgi:hypothetical protein
LEGSLTYNNDNRRAERAFFTKTLELSEECLQTDRNFVASLEKREKEGADPLEPRLWENFISARQSLVDFTTSNLNLLARDRAALETHKDITTRLETTLGEVMVLEEKLHTFLSEKLTVLKETIDEISKNQVLFTSYSKNNYKPLPEALERTA